jgi:hypothetical protein
MKRLMGGEGGGRSTLRRVMSDGVLVFPCPKCQEPLEVGLHVVETAAHPTKKSPVTGTHYGHRVEFVAEAPHLHASFWGHMVRCHQPHPHPYMNNDRSGGFFSGLLSSRTECRDCGAEWTDNHVCGAS